jgi:GTP-binding protein
VIEKMVEGKTFTPYERVFMEMPEIYSGTVIQKMGQRHAELVDMQSHNGVVSLEYVLATKEFFGFRSEFIADTHGLGILNANFLEYRADSGATMARDRGSLISHETGISRMYSLLNAQNRGELFIGPNIEVYRGQVIGQNSREDDIVVNICKEKQQTNMRSRGEGTTDHFNVPRVMSLEEALEYINDSELVEVTPKNIRIRKVVI